MCNETNKVIVYASNSNKSYKLLQSRLSSSQQTQVVTVKEPLDNNLIELINTASITAKITSNGGCYELVEITKGSYSKNNNTFTITRNISPYANSGAGMNMQITNSRDLEISFDVFNASKFQTIIDALNCNSEGSIIATTNQSGTVKVAYQNNQIGNNVARSAITNDAEAISQLFYSIFGDNVVVRDQITSGSSQESVYAKRLLTLKRLLDGLIDDSAMNRLSTAINKQL